MTAVAILPDIITCSLCPRTAKAKPTIKGNLRAPKAWKRIGEQLLCQDCKKKQYRLSAIAFPVATVIDADWKEFTAALKDAWGRSTRLSNWAVRQLLQADAERKAGQEKMHLMPAVNLYRLWQNHHERADWQGGASAANAILHSVDAKYRKKRFGVLWMGNDQPPRYKYPTPYPIHNKDWSADYHEIDGEGGQKLRIPVVSVNLGGKRWLIQVRGGPGFKRQLKAFAQLASGEAMAGELAIYAKRSNGSHRRTASEKPAGGGSRSSIRIMVKLVGYFPRGEAKEIGAGILEVRTGRKALLIAMAPGASRPWLLHADHLRRLIYVHERKLQNISDDLKAEVRPASPALRQRLQDMCYRQGCRIDTEIRRFASMLVKYAKRCKCGMINYSDEDHRYFSSFPWAKLTDYIRQACDRESMEFASGEVAEQEETVEADATV